MVKFIKIYKHSNELLPILANICPWAFGSVILGDPYFWESKSIEEWEEEIENKKDVKQFVCHD